MTCGISYGMGEARNGMVLCGLGTGGLQLATNGSFAQSSLQNNWLGEMEKLLPGSFLAVSAKGASGRRCARMLQAEAPAGIAAVVDLTYTGRYPFVDIAYDDAELPVEVSLEALCPFVPHDAKNSAIPAIIFTFKLVNPAEEAVECTVALSWSNDIGAAAGELINNCNAARESEGLTGVVMGTRREDTVAGHEYAIAVLEAEGVEASVLPEYNAEAEWGDFWGPFAEEGRLHEAAGPLDTTRDLRAASKVAPTGAVAAKVELAAGEEREVSFILAWYMPNHYDINGVFVGHMYANWFDGAWDVAEYVGEKCSYLREKSGEWQSLVARSSLPDSVKQALIANTYVLALASWWVQDGRFALGETPGWLMEMAALRPYDMFACPMLFPELGHHATELLAAEQRESGEIPTGLGNRCMDTPHYVSFRQQNSVSFVMNVYLDYLWYGGEEYLQRMYAAAKRAVEFAMTLDTDGDCLPNCNGIYDTAWDTWPVRGTAVYVAQFTLPALRAAEKMAEVVGDEEFAARCREWGDAAIRNFEAQLWTGEYYALFRDCKLGDFSSTCFIGQLYGQLLGRLLNLGEILPAERIASAIRTIARLNIADTALGATTGVKPDGSRDLSSTRNAQSHCVTPTEIFEFAAACLYHDEAEIGFGLVEKFQRFLVEGARDPWQSLLLFDPDTGENFYGKHYIDNLNVWMILLAAEGIAFDVAEGLLVVKPNLDPLEAPIFSPLLYGTMRYETVREGEEVVGLEIEIVNMRDEAVEVERFVTRFRGASVSSVTFAAATGEARELDFEHHADGDLVIGEGLVLASGKNRLEVRGSC